MRLPVLPSKAILQEGIREVMKNPTHVDEIKEVSDVCNALYQAVEEMPEEAERLAANFLNSFMKTGGGMSPYLFGVMTGLVIAMLASQHEAMFVPPAPIAAV